jgi:hypothetical protein
MPQVVFEPTIPVLAGEDALDGTATVIGIHSF